MNFLTIDTEKCKEATPAYAKGGTWMSHFGHFISPCARATRETLNHAKIGDYRAMKTVSVPSDILSI